MASDKKILISVALAGFVKKFLMSDIDYWQEKGFEVHVAANKNHKGAEGIESFFKNKNIVFHQISFSSHKPFSLATIKSFFELRKLKKNHYSVIHTHMAISSIITRFIFKRCRKNGTKVLYTTHGFAFGKNRRFKECIFYHLEKHASKYTDIIITINHEDYLLAKSFKKCKVEYIHGVGVNFASLDVGAVDKIEYRKKENLPLDKIIVLSIGELSFRKNHIEVLKAINYSKHKNNICYCIAGMDLFSSKIKNKLRQYATSHNIDLRLLGYRNDIPFLAKSADIGVISSFKEGLCFAGIEMIYCGLQLITSRVAGLEDYITDDNGRTYDSGNFVSLAKIIDQLISSPIIVNKKTIIDYSLQNSIAERELIYNKFVI